MRRGSSRERFPADVEFAEGDVTDRAEPRPGPSPGATRWSTRRRWSRSSRRAREFDRINVGGLENVLAAAEAAGSVERMLYVSSFMALGPTDGRVLDESAEPRDRAWINDYERTKTLSDRLARKAIADGAPLSVVYPGVIYGPGEMTEGNIVVRHILDLVHGRLPGLIGSPGAALELRLRRRRRPRRRPRPGGARPTGRYVLGGENVTLGEFYRLVGAGDRREDPHPALPGRRRQGGRRGAEGLVAACAAPPRSSPPTSSRSTSTTGPTTRRKRRRSSATAARPLAEGLASTVAWLQESGQMGKTK